MTVKNFESHKFLQDHVNRTLGFYDANALDPAGGFYHYFLDDGYVYNKSHRHIVSATRFVFTMSMAFVHTGHLYYKDMAEHALKHIDFFKLTRGQQQGLYAWTVSDGFIEDETVMAYGQAFVLLAKSHAHRIGLCSAESVSDVFDLIEANFYSAFDRAYSDEITPSGMLVNYRGQNANMHMCEACLAAYEFTHGDRYLQRALTLIERFVFELSLKTNGLVWEHYQSDWSVDWEYNKNNLENIFKPWGFQTGHQTEWAKLLLIANSHAPDKTLVDKAIHLQEMAFLHGWDFQNGGLIYGFDPTFKPYDTNKYFWVQAESFASAWRLWRLTNNDVFLEQYRKTWAWSWKYMIDHDYGAWYRMVSADGRKLEKTKSPAGKVDYHTMGACWDVMSVGGLNK